MRLAYISSSYRSISKKQVEANVKKAIEYGKIVKKLGYLPFVPHINIFDIMEEGDDVMNFCIEHLKHCDVLIVCEEIITEGMKKEITEAFELDIEVLILKERELVKMYNPKRKESEGKSNSKEDS